MGPNQRLLQSRQSIMNNRSGSLVEDGTCFFFFSPFLRVELFSIYFQHVSGPCSAAMERDCRQASQGSRFWLRFIRNPGIWTCELTSLSPFFPYWFGLWMPNWHIELPDFGENLALLLGPGRHIFCLIMLICIDPLEANIHANLFIHRKWQSKGNCMTTIMDLKQMLTSIRGSR